MKLPIVAATAIIAIAAVGAGLCFTGSGGVSFAQTSAYTPPGTQEGDDGWLTYVDAPEVDPGAAAKLDPAPSSPEAAVVKFLASRMRADTAWKEALVADRSARLDRQLAKWEDWQVESFQLKARKPTRSGGMYVRVLFHITIDGDSDSGTDEFEVVPEGDGWRIASIPA